MYYFYCDDDVLSRYLVGYMSTIYSVFGLSPLPRDTECRCKHDDSQGVGNAQQSRYKRSL